MSQRGIDISGHQDRIDWDALDPARTAFVIVKATGGGTFRNARHPEQVRQARARGRVVGHYSRCRHVRRTAIWEMVAGETRNSAAKSRRPSPAAERRRIARTSSSVR